MKTQAECWQALLDGKTLVRKRGGVEFKLVNGELVNIIYGLTSDCTFLNPSKFEIKQETKTITKEQLDKIIKNGGWQTTAISDAIWSQL